MHSPLFSILFVAINAYISLLLFNANSLPFLYVFPTDPILSPRRPPFLPAKFMADFEVKAVFNVINKVFNALFTCAFAFGSFLNNYTIFIC